jgi:hypothetical protein
VVTTDCTSLSTAWSVNYVATHLKTNVKEISPEKARGSNFRTFALNLGQLTGCPLHWDLDEIPAIGRVFDSELSPSKSGNTRRNRSSRRVLFPEVGVIVSE